MRDRSKQDNLSQFYCKPKAFNQILYTRALVQIPTHYECVFFFSLRFLFVKKRLTTRRKSFARGYAIIYISMLASRDPNFIPHINTFFTYSIICCRVLAVWRHRGAAKKIMQCSWLSSHTAESRAAAHTPQMPAAAANASVFSVDDHVAGTPSRRGALACSGILFGQ